MYIQKHKNQVTSENEARNLYDYIIKFGNLSSKFLSSTYLTVPSIYVFLVIIQNPFFEFSLI